MNHDGTATVQPKECPVCQDEFNTGVTVPKVFGVCGHSVCAVCVPGCIARPGHATCPLCRQDTPVPANGLPTNFDFRDSLESLETALNVPTVQCSRCKKNVCWSSTFACKTCSTGSYKHVFVCGFCAVKAHRTHELIERTALASRTAIVQFMSDVRHRHGFVQTQLAAAATEMTEAIKDEVKLLAMTLQRDDDDYTDVSRLASLMTREELVQEKNKSTENLRRKKGVVNAAQKAIQSATARCREELAKIRADSMQPSTSGVQQSAVSQTDTRKRPGSIPDKTLPMKNAKRRC